MRISKISIVTVTYNSSPHIRKLLDSIRRNIELVDEVIIVDNNSTDSSTTESICNKYRKSLNLRYISSDNHGYGKSSNLGVKFARNEYILLLNPDTELLEGALAILYKHMILDNADIIGGKATDYMGNIHNSAVRFPTISTCLFEFSNLGKILRYYKPNQIFYYKDIDIMNSIIDMQVDVISGAYLLISKKNFLEIGGFDENIFMYLEDVDFCKRASNFGLKVVFCPHSKILHVGGASSMNKYRINQKAWFESRKYYCVKYFSVFVNLLIQPLYNMEEIYLKKYRRV